MKVCKHFAPVLALALLTWQGTLAQAGHLDRRWLQKKA
jgi:hypothetical protein